jgi:regulator of PEP synthase PpsR (kinase-PPPase family)
VNAAKPPVELHVISDSTGETAVRLVHALEAQFPEQEFEEIRHPRVETVDDLHLALSRAKGRAAVIVYTLVHPELRARSAAATSSTTATCSATRSRPSRASRASPPR